MSACQRYRTGALSTEQTSSGQQQTSACEQYKQANNIGAIATDDQILQAAVDVMAGTLNISCAESIGASGSTQRLPSTQPAAGQQQAAASNGSGGGLIFLGFIGLLGLMYFAGKK